MRRGIVRLLLAATIVVGQLLLFATVANAADISSTGPLTHIFVTPDLNCQVAHVEDELFEFYPSSDELGSCGTVLFVNGTLYGPAEMPAGGFTSPTTPWTPVSQSAVTGNGSSNDPFTVVTTVDAAGSGLRVVQTDSYVLGTQLYKTDVQITNTGSVAQSGVLYRVGDCYLQGSDVGFGRVDDGAPACVAANGSTARIEQWTPLTPGSHYMEDYYGYVYAAVNGQQLPNTCPCTFGELDATDNGAGLSWAISAAPGQSVTFSHDTFFSPTGRAPVTTSYTQSVPDPTQITLDPVVLATSAVVTAGVILLVPFPSALFNATLEENYDEVMAGVGRASRRVRSWWTRFVSWVRTRGVPQAATSQKVDLQPSATSEAPMHPMGGPLPGQPLPLPTLSPTPGPEISPRVSAVTDPTSPQAANDVWRTPLGILGFVVLSAVLYAFLDPTFGFSLTSLATLLGLALGLVVILVAYGTPLLLFSRTHSIGLDVRALPATLIVAVICVLVSRLASFQPGYLYGLIVGFYFAHSVAREVEGKAEAAAAGASLAAAFIAWVLLAFLRAGGSVDEFSNALLQAATVTVVVAGLENAVFAMLPLRFLPGAAVFGWNKIVWGLLLGFGVFGFAHVLINPSNGAGYLADTTRTSFITMIVLLAGFGLASVLFWAWFRFRPDPHRKEGQAL